MKRFMAEMAGKMGKNIVKAVGKFFLFAFAAAFLAAVPGFCGITACAEEGEELSVRLIMTDETGSDYDGTVTLRIFDRNTAELVSTQELTKENSWGSGEAYVFQLKADINYTMITGTEEGVYLIDTDTRDEVQDLKLNGAVSEKHWSVISYGKTDQKEDTPEEKTAAGTGSEGDLQEQMSEQETIQEEQAGEYTLPQNVEITDPEAQEVFEEFLNAVSFIETDESWYIDKTNGFQFLLARYGKGGMNNAPLAEMYEKYVRGGTKEEYESMPGYEAWLWADTYLRFANYINAGTYDHYFGSEEKFQQNVLFWITVEMTGNNAEIVKEAYEKLAWWQYEYIKEHGVPFNFINNRSYLEEMAESVEETVPVKETEDKKAEQEIEELRKELEKDDEVKEAIEEAEQELEKEAETEESSSAEKSVWSGFFDKLAKSLLTLFLLAVLGITAAVLVLKQRKNAKKG